MDMQPEATVGDVKKQPAVGERPAPPKSDEFSLSGTALLSGRKLHTLKQGDMFGVFDQTGDILWGKDIADGLYYHDTRYLSGLTFRLGGQRPVLLSSVVRENNVMLSVNMTNESLPLSDGERLAHDLLHVRRSRFLWKGRCFERIEIRNFDVLPHNVSCDMRFFADYADLFEARGARRAKRGQFLDPAIGENEVTLSYMGLDKKKRSTRLLFSPTPQKLSADYAAFEFSIAPGERALIHVEIQCDPSERSTVPPNRAFLNGAVAARRALRRTSSQATAIATSNEIFNEAIRRCICDIYMLLTEKKTGHYPYAGVPWYSTVFGRDGLITALQTLWIDPSIAKGVLLYLAANQADEEDPIADAEPGKILHEVRLGEMAELGEVPFRRYYGSIDSTPLFVMLAGEYLDRTGDVGTLSHLWPHVTRAVDWIERFGDRDGDGFVEYGRRNKDGLVNQGWKDSFDSIFHADGALAEGPIALCEVQAYVYAARRAAARIGRRLGQTAYAAHQDERAETLRVTFNLKFWNEDIGTYVIALDGKKEQCAVRSSNAGHVLLTDIAPAERREQVVRTLMHRNSFCGWGIRTIPEGEARYNPMSYHNGTVWPHDNSLIAMGFARHGYRDEAVQIFEALFTAAFYTDLRRLPELYCGFTRDRSEGPVRYPVACSPQAWAAAALPAVLQAILGLRYDPGSVSVEFTRPCLPESIESLTLFNLAVGGEHLTARVVRVGDEVAINVVERSPSIRLHIVN
ncbi:amylo-alpha-1,6-glucosidase [Acetobacter nitrogenifigens DSM 23921 = NBRC 105050]|uniref:Amylo-alpha-1,6-glucosidase n=1 Tax=Acetobacter nitrogenifigens DSM 23921 = NBRC 105050 TaxID=1120919 RepID=A0A511XAM2_9PROT|nr:glycogen debranching N-terminal domain-containing protein [Acetobacter nitrogenifigens]GBQ91098.1 amylo-alpha-1,6-glucosidase [Acetobacter nitrogenifigens DSM 23921 = NBRC 105050]GEN60000.1 amylo-alpha-1,6-glucosidase [Acetobacter nitrogenifigens DSM 23921 = NBRC 105050]